MTSHTSDYHREYLPDGLYSPFQVERSDVISVLKNSIEHSLGTDLIDKTKFEVRYISICGRNNYCKCTSFYMEEKW